jgi:hypothetical protein
VVLPASAEDFFEPLLSHHGYDGFFWGKRSSAASQYGCPGDGCALFFKAARFKPLGPPVGEVPIPIRYAPHSHSHSPGALVTGACSQLQQLRTNEVALVTGARGALSCSSCEQTAWAFHAWSEQTGLPGLLFLLLQGWTY